MLILALGYKEYNTKRKYLVTLGNWRNNKDEEVELDGIGGVNILVKADVHRSGAQHRCYTRCALHADRLLRHKFSLLCVREPGRNRRVCENGQKGRIPGRWTTKLRGLAH